MTEEQLIALLQKYQIDISRFGQEDAKTLEQLLAEIYSGESQLVEAGGRFIRKVSVLQVDVYAIIKGRRLKLVEDRQEFLDGRVRKRRMAHSVNEKLLPGEDAFSAVGRALAEEIGVHRYKITSSEAVVTTETKVSPSYPGLITEFFLHTLRVLVPALDFNPDGYSEKQADKTTYFVWEAAGSC